MRVGIQLIFQNLHQDLADGEIVRGEVALGERAERAGFDFLGCPEHHFASYSMCPDNIQLLTWLAARTSRIDLLISGAVLPWQDPLRVAEKTILLDHLSNGRVLFGIGRGLARMEYEAFRQDMSQARARLDESTAMVVEALETGVMRGSGPFYVQPEIEIRPRPAHSFRDRLYSVAVSKDSVDAAADVGSVMMSFTRLPDAAQLPMITHYRDRFQTKHRRSAPPPILIDFTYCHEDPAVAEQVAREYLLRSYVATHRHYDMDGQHFQRTKGYESYQVQADEVRAIGLNRAADEYIDAQIWGTPGQIIDRYRKRVDTLGPIAASLAVSYGGLPFGAAAASMELLGAEVLPALKVL